MKVDGSPKDAAEAADAASDKNTIEGIKDFMEQQENQLALKKLGYAKATFDKLP